MKKVIFLSGFFLVVAGLVTISSLSAMGQNKMEQYKFAKMYDKLYAAIEKNDIPAVEQLIQKKVPINRQSIVEGFEGITPLHYAAFLGREEIIKILIKNGADKTISDWNFERTPLAFACVAGHYELAPLLIEGGNDTENGDDIENDDIENIEFGGCFSTQDPGFLTKNWGSLRSLIKPYIKPYYKSTEKFIRDWGTYLYEKGYNLRKKIH